jgi:GNAT superfamily N-acetyltransferase
VSAEGLFEPEPLGADHDIAGFDCGREPLNAYLSRWALADQSAGKSRTYVACRGITVVAFFSLAAGSVEPETATSRVAKGQGRQPIPVILLARLAVDLRGQGRGLGEAMLVDALRRCVAAADVIGARAVIVHAKDAQARSFYARYGFEPSPTNPLHLLLLVKDVRKSLGK